MRLHDERNVLWAAFEPLGRLRCGEVIQHWKHHVQIQQASSAMTPFEEDKQDESVGS